MDIFLTRQPVFDRDRNVYAYDLMFQSDFGSLHQNPDWDKANDVAIALSLLSGSPATITRGKPAFIRFTRNMLEQEIGDIFPENSIFVELSHVHDDAVDVATACQRLKESGCPIIVDISSNGRPAATLIELADIVKVDMADPSAMAGRMKFAAACHLASNVNSVASFERAIDLGFHYFQGNFYCEPNLRQATGVPFSKLNHLLLLQEINRPDISFDKLSAIIKRDVGLSYKLMRYINSAHFGFPSEISSLRHALALMGVVNIKHWLYQETLHEIGKNKPDELFINAIVRARFGELLAETVGCQAHASEIFLTGLFSRLDAFLDRSLGTILRELPVSDNIRNTLLGNHSDYIDIYQLMLAYERGDWQEVNNLAAMVGLRPSGLPVVFIRALEWSQQMFGDV